MIDLTWTNFLQRKRGDSISAVRKVDAPPAQDGPAAMGFDPKIDVTRVSRDRGQPPKMHVPAAMALDPQLGPERVTRSSRIVEVDGEPVADQRCKPIRRGRGGA